MYAIMGLNLLLQNGKNLPCLGIRSGLVSISGICGDKTEADEAVLNLAFLEFFLRLSLLPG